MRKVPDPSNYDSIRSLNERTYDLAADRYIETFYEDDSDVDLLKKLCERLDLSSVVGDIGSGPGNYSRQVVDIRPDISMIGVDLSLPMLTAGRAVWNDFVAVQADMLRLPFADGRFDGLLVAYSLLHLPRSLLDHALKEFRRVLKTGGIALFMFKEGTGESYIDASLVPGGKCFVSYWSAKEFREVLSTSTWSVVLTDKSPPVVAEEIQSARIAVLAVAS